MALKTLERQILVGLLAELSHHPVQLPIIQTQQNCHNYCDIMSRGKIILTVCNFPKATKYVVILCCEGVETQIFPICD